VTTMRPASEPGEWEEYELPQPSRLASMALRTWLRAVSAAWPLVISLPIVTMALVGVWLRWVAVPIYTTHMSVAPYVDQSSAVRRTDTLGGLSSVLGFGAPSSSNFNFNLYLETRLSVALASRLLQIPEVRRAVYGEEWNEETGQWRRPHGVIFALRELVRSIFGLPGWSPPTANDFASYLQKRVKQESDRQRNYFAFYFDNRDPVLGMALLQDIHTGAEAMLRDDAQKRTAVKIDHLIQQIGASTLTENRSALTALLGEEQRESMLIAPEIPFAAIVVDPPSATHYPTSPRALRDLFFAVLAGAALAVVIVVIREEYARSRLASKRIAV